MTPGTFRCPWLACVFAIALAPGGALLDARQGPPAQPPAEARPSAVAVPPPEGAQRTGPRPDADDTRLEFRQLLDRHPPALQAVLRLDPALLGDGTYLAPYPELQAFVAAHPEITRNPSFFLGEPGLSRLDTSPQALALRAWERVFEMFSMMGVFLTLTLAVAWLVRTLLDYRRWLRTSRVQAEAHAKLLDRLTQNDDLLTYVNSPAGGAFLASAPIAIDAGPPVASAPVSRILWSVQAGVVLAFVGLGLLWASTRVAAEMGPPLSVLGILAIMGGAGFVAAALVALALARRLGLAEAPSGETLPPVRGAGSVS